MEKKMKLDVGITITLNENQLSEIIKEYLLTQGYEAAEDVVFKIGERCEGYGSGEHYVRYFESASVKG